VPAGLARELNRIAGRVDGPFDVIVGESTITSIGPAAMECGCVHLWRRAVMHTVLPPIM
jgi:hypothetical protein